ncbi:GntR family transcriptional regulator [Paenibacillus spongiae]|uniref:GntR family transcriptional regulator n=1 Tax=Paenibacillus spongiae TaxID=2909671 RepID=A0ABY5SH88_9BACL|nr:GntR family transcriptional regulator [Paenibacillus spongiae]UVI33366.1 GntR family transcriptional regulator [Paenibacillus spongiae]
MKNFTFTQQSNLSLREKVVVEIRNAILRGNLSAGERIKENDIAIQMGVSRGPVREAIQQLELEGFVVSYPYRETVVAEINVSEIKDYLTPIRYHLESTVIQKNLDAINDVFLGQLQEIIDVMDSHLADTDVHFWVEQDLLFHETIIRLAPERTVQLIWESVSNRIKLHFNQRTGSYDKQQFVHDHQHLLDIMRTRDIDLIKQTLLEHMNLY